MFGVNVNFKHGPRILLLEAMMFSWKIQLESLWRVVIVDVFNGIWFAWNSKLHGAFLVPFLLRLIFFLNQLVKILMCNMG